MPLGSRCGLQANFATLLGQLREAFDAEGASTNRAPLLLTAAVGIGPTTADNAYDVPKLNEYMDFINLMTYDMQLGLPSRPKNHCNVLSLQRLNARGLSSGLHALSEHQQGMVAGAPRRSPSTASSMRGLETLSMMACRSVGSGQ